jgi:signal transduction histidine kinase/DNA-binding NarL/FixJ family response regulator
MLDFALEEILTVVNIYYPLKGSYFISGLSALLWAFALAIRFNNEYKELQSLKQSLEAKVAERTKELEFAVEQRTNTFVNLAHEVRTPLTLVSNYTDEQIKNHGSTAEIRIIKENTEKLLRVISNFFTEEKFRQGTILFDHNQIINFSEFISAKAEMFAPNIRRKCQKLETEIYPGIFIKADPIALESLINNLVENSIRYTPEEGTISIMLACSESNIQLTIKDNGIGIPEEAKSKIFKPYYQVTEKKQNSQGIGVGLSIVNNIVKSLGGKITLNSKQGRGTTFTIELPGYKLAIDERIQEYEHHAPIVNSHISVNDEVDPEKKNTVLLVEDNLQLLCFLASKLKEYFNIYAAADGKKALEKLKSMPRPQLIISDIMMDNMDGYEFFETITKNGYHSIPFIFLTAKTTASEKMKGLQMGAVDFISKPFKLNELISKAISIIKHSEKQKHELVKNVSKFLNNLVDVPVNEVKESGFDYNCYSFNISDREKEIIKCIEEGCTYKEIGQKLFIAKTTVAKHVQNIYEKTGTKNKVELLGRMNR